jgi:hypothetical protein
MRALLRRLAVASPLVPALIYAATACLANVVATLAPKHSPLIVLAAILWLVVALVFLTVVVWYRDDDWLAAGFLLGITLLLSAWSGDVVAQSITLGSIGPALLAAPAMMFGIIIRALIGVPLLGGLVALLRWITRAIRGLRASPAS